MELDRSIERPRARLARAHSGAPPRPRRWRSSTRPWRSKEIAVQVACGARPESVLGLMLGHSTTLAGTGVAVGLVTAALASRTMTGYLYGVTHTDPVIYAGVSIALIALTVAVSAIPARRAASIDPVTALRED